ncbi:MAG: pentapeptide repeat-containing protein, partial [Acidobacteria bacterium]|nr:pentapeptide repeat-containing protein [Acidobacteriota bacterium]
MPYYVTFYSYKGGVGRTLALVNVAVNLLERGHSVFIWELDLEAPGLLNIPLFQKLQAKGGTVNLILDPPGDDAGPALSRYVLEHPQHERLRVLPAGPTDRYAGLYEKIRWENWFGEGSTAGSELFERLRQAVDGYNSDFVLIDSRTGLTDVGALCTIQLPDTVVLVYQLSHQNLKGAQEIQLALRSARLKRFRRTELDLLLVASMVPSDSPELSRARQKAAEQFNLRPHVTVPLSPALLLEESVVTGDGQSPLAEAYGRIASLLEERATAAKTTPRDEPVRLREPEHDDRVRRGRTFEDKVAQVLRLLGYEVEVNVLESGSQVDIIARKQDPVNPTTALVECKDHEKPSGVVDVRALHSRVAAASDRNARGLLVSRSGFTAEAKSQAANLPISLTTYDDLLSGLVDLRDYLADLIRDVEGKDIERLYVEQDVWPENAKEPLSLAGFVKDWIGKPDQVFLALLGDYGTGKTWFTRKLAHDLARLYQKDRGRSRQPIRIDLKEVAKAFTLENILYDHFQKSGRAVNPKSILYLLAEGWYVLILDGFDEMATQANWEVTLANFRELERAAEGKAKVILTCRTHYFKDRAKEEEAVRGGDLATKEGTQLYREIFGKPGFSITYLREFTPAQIEEYLGRACGPRALEVKAAIERIPSIEQISGRPVLLDMIVQSAPQLAKAGGDVKVAHLYQVFTEEWMRRQDWRLRLTREGRTALVEELAVKLWEAGSTRLHYRELAPVLAGLLKEKIKTLEDLEIAEQEVRSASFLTRDAEGNYGFSHRSFLEFFLAQRTARTLDFRLPRLTPPVIAFLRDLCPAEKLEPAVRNVLASPYTPLSSENALWIARAMDLKVENAQLAGAQLAGAVLTGAWLKGVDFGNANLAGVDLSKAILAEARFAEADLTEARLVEANLERTDFSKANLAGAVMDSALCAGANFSEADLSFASLFQANVHNAKFENSDRYGMALVPEGHLTPIVQTGTARAVSAIDWSPDGKLIAAASEDGVIRVHDGVTGQVRRILAGHTAPVNAIAWSRDGRLLASGSDDKTVRLWQPSSGKLVRTLEGHQYGVSAVAWRGDGRQLASGSSDQTVRLWEPSSGKLVRTLEGHQYGVSAVAWSEDGRLLAS